MEPLCFREWHQYKIWYPNILRKIIEYSKSIPLFVSSHASDPLFKSLGFRNVIQLYHYYFPFEEEKLHCFVNVGCLVWRPNGFRPIICEFIGLGLKNLCCRLVRATK